MAKKLAQRSFFSLFSLNLPSALFIVMALTTSAAGIAYRLKGNDAQLSTANAYTNAADPIKLAHFYKPANNKTAPELAGLVQTLVLTRNDEAAVIQAKAAGLTTPILQYLILDSIQGPSNLSNDTVGACTSSQRSFITRANQVANETGEFCEIHDSIVNGTSFDHDLNPATPAVTATETWFLHNNRGQRIGNYGGNGFYYHINLGHQQVREYYLARILRELEGSASHPKTGMDGIFLDNLELSWAKKLTRLDIKGQPVEYASSAAWVEAVRGAMATFYPTLQQKGYPVWANMIENPRAGNDWNAFAPYLDGGMEEGFALDWNGKPRSAEHLESQLQQAQSWQGLGKHYLAVAQGTDSQSEANYGLASMLLVTDGTRMVYRHGDSSSYTTFWEYPEYNYVLGEPQGVRYQLSSSTDVIWARDFNCGKVSVNMTRGTSSIDLLPCQVTPPSPLPSPSAVPTPSPLPSPSPSPAATPTPNPTDTTAPEVSLISPTPGTNVTPRKDILLEATATDNVGISKVVFAINGKTLCTDTTASYSCTWSASNKAGSYTITATAYDTRGNNTSSSVNVTVTK